MRGLPVCVRGSVCDVSVHISNISLSHVFTRFLACAFLKKHHRHDCDNTTGHKVDNDGNGPTGYDDNDDGDGRLQQQRQHSQLQGGGASRGGGGAIRNNQTMRGETRRKLVTKTPGSVMNDNVKNVDNTVCNMGHVAQWC